MRLPYSPPLIVPLSSASPAGSATSLASASAGDADANGAPAQGATGSAVNHV